MNRLVLPKLLTTAFIRTYRRKWVVSRLYWALAECEPCGFRQEILRMLALQSERSAVRYALRLHRLGVTLPSNSDRYCDRLWRWLLVRCGSRWALAWIDWLENSDISLYAHIFAKHRPTPNSTNS